MKRSVWGFCVATACALAVSVGAQTYQTEKQERKTTTEKGKTVTLTGCLSKGTGTADYVLTNVTAGTIKPEATGPTGTTGTMTKGTELKSDELKGSWKIESTADVDLSKHVGHKVEVTGVTADLIKTTTEKTVETERPPGSEQKTETKTKTESKASLTMGGEKKLKVRSINHIAETCQ